MDNRIKELKRYTMETMESLQETFGKEEFRDKKVLLIAVARYILIIINAVYANLTYLMWTTLLKPLRWAMLNEDLYWYCEGLLYQNNLSFFSFWTYISGYHIVEQGDDVSDVLEEPSLVLINHQSMADVPLVMSAFNSRHNLSNNIMWIIYAGFKHTNFGIIANGHRDFFIDVGKEKRESSLANLAIHLKKIYLPLHRHWIAIFPEGDFMLRCRASNQKYAKEHGYPVLENCLLPRVGAVKTIMDTARANSHTDSGSKLKYLIDVTVAYPDINHPMEFNTILSGMKPPCDTIFHYRKYYIEEIPHDEAGLTSWLYERYQEKDALLAEYYKTGKFPDHPTKHPINIKHSNQARLPGKRIHEDNWQFGINHGFCILSMVLAYWMIAHAFRYINLTFRIIGFIVSCFVCLLPFLGDAIFIGTIIYLLAKEIQK